MTFRIKFEDSGKFIRGQMEFWRQARESDCFDLEGITAPQGTSGLMSYDNEPNDDRYPHPVLVKRYVRFGLHRYNMAHGTKLELCHIKKVNMRTSHMATYYITLTAFDRDTTSLETLQIGVDEGCRGTCSLNATCFIARLKGAPREPVQYGHDSGRVDAQLPPYWPSDFSDSQRFYEVKETELQENDWIHLYMELVLCTNDRLVEEQEMSQLQIVKVVIEAIEGNEEPLRARDANVYITFKGFANARVGELGEHVERKVIVRRAINEQTGCMTLLGEYGFSVGEVVEKRFIFRPTIVDGVPLCRYVPMDNPRQ